MNPTDFEKIESCISAMKEALPVAFGETLPPRLFTRYMTVVLSIQSYHKQVLEFQAVLSGIPYLNPQKPLRKPPETLSSPQFHVLDQKFQLMHQLLPHKFQAQLPEELRKLHMQLLRDLARVQGASQQLHKALQQKGLL
ncbi:MAG: hypothetical protein VR73_11120 [Gammaproteobacteria bacterium BRH_c0]|nr:MAG: hypothetical protein VR73_11120 [Gammaproteobacteria bacterium BRH_c0]